MVTAVLPLIIQGGMGIGVSDWRLARAVSLHQQLGVVSGTSLDAVLVRRLQDGDEGGHMRRGMERFPVPGVADEVLHRYHLPGGSPPNASYKSIPLWKQTVSRARTQLTMLATFVQVHLAKEGHEGPVGLNLLTKVQFPNLAALYGALLAGVDYVLMGAGIPREIPEVLDLLSEHRPAALKLEVDGLPPGRSEQLVFDPRAHWDGPPPPLRRPLFLPIIASNSLATVLARKASGRVDGFVVEGPTAGGHNAPPRGEPRFNERGEPIYGERDEVDLAKLRELGLPFWVAGGAGSPEAWRTRSSRRREVQVEPLLRGVGRGPGVRRRCSGGRRGGRRLRPRASPTGYPFKVVPGQAIQRSSPHSAAISGTCEPRMRRTVRSAIAVRPSRWRTMRKNGGRGFRGRRCSATHCWPTSAWANREDGGRSCRATSGDVSDDCAFLPAAPPTRRGRAGLSLAD
jgi:NAD(P)H-dependent flavin oxidoreductase YrpB (nitropropane dioxygenase family)